MHYYKMDIAKWVQSTRGLLPEDEGIYLRLILHYYDTEKAIPEDMRLILKRLQLLPYADQVAEILNDYFYLTAQGWKHKKCDEILKEYHRNARKNKINGAKGGRPRKTKADSITQSKPNGLPVGTDSQPKQKAISNYKLETINDNNTATKRFVAPTLSDVSDYQKEKKLTLHPEQFINFYESKGWMVGKTKMRDWKAAARGWSTRENKEQKGSNNGKLKLPRDDEQLTTFAKNNGLPCAISGENFWQYRNRLNAEIEKRANQ